MSSDTLPQPSESPRDVLKRKRDDWRRRIAAWWHSLGAPAAPPPGNTTARSASGASHPARRRSGRTQKRMIWISGAALIVLAFVNEVLTKSEHGPLWRVLVAIAAFLYLWWLGSLVFDLVFVWHRYIQADAAHKFLREEVAPADFKPENDPPTDEDSSGKTSLIPPSTPGPAGEGPSIPAPWNPKISAEWTWPAT
jgi:hypothetical protein